MNLVFLDPIITYHKIVEARSECNAPTCRVAVHGEFVVVAGEVYGEGTPHGCDNTDTCQKLIREELLLCNLQQTVATVFPIVVTKRLPQILEGTDLVVIAAIFAPGITTQSYPVVITPSSP